MVSVTRLISLLDKPAIAKWANRIGLEGVSLDEYRKRSKSKGSNRHKEIEDYLNDGVEFDGYEKLNKSLDGFELVGCEVAMDNGFINGRADLIISKEGKNYICDFKKGNNVYLQTKLQLSTYKHIYGAEKICFINTDNLKIVELNIDTEPYFEIMKRLYQINELLEHLNERL